VLESNRSIRDHFYNFSKHIRRKNWRFRHEMKPFTQAKLSTTLTFKKKFLRTPKMVIIKYRCICNITAVI
jgi:hypothetical protein